MNELLHSIDIIDKLLTILDKLKTACITLHTLNEIENIDITVTLDSISNSQDCFGIPFIHEFV